MNSTVKLIIIGILFLLGIGLMIWGNYIMMHYENFREVWKAARQAARPQFIWGLILLVLAYILTYSKK